MLTADDLARWLAIRKDGRVKVGHRGDRVGPWLHWLRCDRCGYETRGLGSSAMIEHWKREHAQEWREAT